MRKVVYNSDVSEVAKPEGPRPSDIGKVSTNRADDSYAQIAAELDEFEGSGSDSDKPQIDLIKYLLKTFLARGNKKDRVAG